MGCDVGRRNANVERFAHANQQEDIAQEGHGMSHMQRACIEKSELQPVWGVVLRAVLHSVVSARAWEGRLSVLQELCGESPHILRNTTHSGANLAIDRFLLHLKKSQKKGENRAERARASLVLGREDGEREREKWRRSTARSTARSTMHSTIASIPFTHPPEVPRLRCTAFPRLTRDSEHTWMLSMRPSWSSMPRSCVSRAISCI
eukprot:6205573-Pleurochrysis_carterae.AAC.1